ncbi:TPA: glycosyltransferase [Elizabethkingia meningoseptica]|uniref:glycosyltransferase n=1 Tax=Elizabethkingia meningoseptica TaxID=238 RepID=UPI0022F19B23|nr:glycosyltransferase [Elizabethkingia meningoseptica]EJK5329540.1 glycosyltransferase [Elizabethkingia meningoseptica]WBS75940.1 glycosyltransferase [Elizabethkingia meningoseptica]HAY3562887.1 glycosyltransferase [Elizabethkingia meningoseptica]
MKVLQLGKFYPIRGGVEKVMYDLMTGLSEGGVYCDMLCASTEDYPAGIIDINAHAKLIVVPTKLKLAATMMAPSMISKLRQIAKDYDIIHIHHPDPMASLALLLSGFKGKVVLHWHSDILKQKTLLKLYTPLQNWLLKRADVIVGTTPVYVRESSFLQHVQHKIDYIPIGIEYVEADTEKVEIIKNKYKDKHFIFSLGRLVEYKGYEYLIRAAQHLDDNYCIVIGGRGPLMESLTSLINELGVQNKVSLLGFVADEDIFSYFEACDLFCLSSIWKTEAFAIVQIEAMSYGKPIISAHIPGSGVSWVNKNEVSGLVVESENDLALADAIKEISTNAVLKQRLSEGSKKRYEENFTRKKMAEKCLSLYSEILMLK